MGSFGTAFFEEIGDGNGSGTSFASSAAGRRIVVPGRAGSVFSRNYASSHTLETMALGSYAEIDALRGRVGQADTLTLQNTLGVALLLSVRPARVFLSDCYTASLTFRWAGAIGPGPGLGGYGSIYGNNLDGM
jgi:hypothetical protein